MGKARRNRLIRSQHNKGEARQLRRILWMTSFPRSKPKKIVHVPAIAFNPEEYARMIKTQKGYER